MANVTVTLNPDAMEKLNGAMKRALVQTATEILSRERNMAVMPMDTGNLQNESTYVQADVTGAKASIVTDAPQARRLYYNPQYNFRSDHNANARGEWWEPWISGSQAKMPPQIFAAFVKEFGNGVIV